MGDASDLATTQALSVTFQGETPATAALTVCRAPGAPLRRIRITTASLSVLLEEAEGGGMLSVQADEEFTGLAAGAETFRQQQRPRGRRIPVLVPDPRRAVVERFLRRIDQGGADDLATLIYGLTLMNRLTESLQREGQALTVRYRTDVQESPRLRLLRGGRPDDAPAICSLPRPTLNIVS